jgi:hypothetical protein
MRKTDACAQAWQMLASPLVRVVRDVRLAKRLWWRDADTGCRLVITHPYAEPDLWQQYAAGAEHSYRRHGVECALDPDALATGDDTAAFFVVVDDGDTVLGGVRAKGPYGRAQDSHALIEWADQPGEAAVKKMITDRIPYGVVEFKTAWICENAPDGQKVADAIARSPFHIMTVLDVQFTMATAAAYVLNKWRSSGGVVAPIPATPYPDSRYQTKLMWFDRSAFTAHAQPRQTAKILTETLTLRSELAARIASSLSWQNSAHGTAAVASN